VFTARYARSPYINQIRIVFKGLMRVLGFMYLPNVKNTCIRKIKIDVLIGNVGAPLMVCCLSQPCDRFCEKRGNCCSLGLVGVS
jgi:hypothetical protein